MTSYKDSGSAWCFYGEYEMTFALRAKQPV